MGRKKIEIRPLTDERNRNVTFLKRKAGLMKKAWELSVLCSADVSIMIFSSQGKAYEFSSKDLESEIDRYLDYEGLIERRRAEEFAAMALAGEDEEDDEEDGPPRRGSTSKTLPNGQPAPTKSLKGKESFKARLPSREELNRALARAKDGRRSKRDRRKSRAKVDSRGRSFIDGILSDEDSSDDDSERDRLDDRRKRRREDPHEDPNGGIAGLQYALSMHQAPPLPSTESELGPFFAHSQSSLPRPSYRSGGSYAAPSNAHESWSTNGLPTQDNQLSYLAPHPGHPVPSTPGSLPNGMQWNQDLIARYAEFQLQQNHQKQQRLLLERQRAQMAEMGIPVDDRSLLDQIFGGGGGSGSAPSQVSPVAQQVESGHSSGNVSTEAFEWPQLNAGPGRRDEVKEQMYANGSGNPYLDQQRYVQNGMGGMSGGVDDIPWGVGGERLGLPTPPSPGRMGMDRRRMDVGL